MIFFIILVMVAAVALVGAMILWEVRKSRRPRAHNEEVEAIGDKADIATTNFPGADF